MLEDVQKVDLTKADLDIIEAALATQEKILAVQSRAGGRTARLKLNDLKSLMRRLRRQVPDPAEKPAAPSRWNIRTLACMFL
jgi:hypothetical protein